MKIEGNILLSVMGKNGVNFKSEPKLLLFFNENIFDSFIDKLTFIIITNNVYHTME